MALHNLVNTYPLEKYIEHSNEKLGADLMADRTVCGTCMCPCADSYVVECLQEGWSRASIARTKQCPISVLHAVSHMTLLRTELDPSNKIVSPNKSLTQLVFPHRIEVPDVLF